MGRRLLKDEITRNEVIDLSWATISQALRSSKVSLEEKRRIALEIVKRTAPQDLNVKAQLSWADMVRGSYESIPSRN